MTTESEARDLLARAAATITVDATAPSALTVLPEPRGRRPGTVMLAAAAAVVVAVGAGVLVGAQLGEDGPTPGPAMSPTVTETPSDRAPAVPDDPAIDREDQLRRAAETFRAWASGQWAMPPDFAGEVRLLLQDDPWDTLARKAAQNRASWSMCSGVAPAACSLDPIKLLTQADGVTFSRIPGSVCADLDGTLPRDLERALANDFGRLSPVRSDCATAWHVELWFNDAGEIYAVNVVISPENSIAQ